MNNKQAYENWYNTNTGKQQTQERILQPWHYNGLEFFNDLSVFKGKKILEIGCGTGDFSIFLNQHGAEVTAVDFSDKAIEIATEKAQHLKASIHFFTADAQNIPLDDEAFDFVFSFECLEHVPEPNRLIAEAYRLLKSKGQLVLTTENYSNAYAPFRLYKYLRNQPFDSGSGIQPIEHFFVFWRIKKKLRNVGFRNLKLKGSHYVFLLLPGFAPHAFTLIKHKLSFLNSIFKPLSRHMTYYAKKI